MFINFFAPDLDAKQTMITALEQKNNNFCFPHDKRGSCVITFTRRMYTIFQYINKLQGEPIGGLLVNRQTRLYSGMFCNNWQLDFKKSREPDLNNANISMIRNFMLLKQQEVEKQRKKNPSFQRGGNGNNNGNGNGKSDDQVPYSRQRNRNGNQYQHQRYQNNNNRGRRYNNSNRNNQRSRGDDNNRNGRSGQQNNNNNNNNNCNTNDPNAPCHMRGHNNLWGDCPNNCMETSRINNNNSNDNNPQGCDRMGNYCNNQTQGYFAQGNYCHQPNHGYHPQPFQHHPPNDAFLNNNNYYQQQLPPPPNNPRFQNFYNNYNLPPYHMR